MKALVLYHSLYGNTKSIALALTRGLENSGIPTTCASVDDFNINDISRFNFIAIGGPTHILKISKRMKEFFEELDTIKLKGVFGFSFDTRNESKMNKRILFVLENSAARVIEGKMKYMKMTIIRPRESAIVFGREGPLDSGVEERFLAIGLEIGRILMNKENPHIVKIQD